MLQCVPQETLKQRKQQLASALASGPRMHARSRGTFMRVHQDHEKAVFLSNRFDQKELAAAAAPAKMPGTLVGGGGVGERVLRCEGEGQEGLKQCAASQVWSSCTQGWGLRSVGCCVGNSGYDSFSQLPQAPRHQCHIYCVA